MPMHLLKHADQLLASVDGRAMVALAAAGVLLVGLIDYSAGYELSISLFYLGPVAAATWYAGRRAGVLIAAASCVSWYVADIAAGHPYSHPGIPVWNALVRLGFFLITALLLAALHDALRRQRELARTDALTGLHSRRAFEERLAHDLALARRRQTMLSLAYIDLDDFKSINDSLGHAQGDRVLRAVGLALARALREADTAARLGGDEFALALPDTDEQGARLAVEKVRSEIASALRQAGLAASCSIGVVSFRRPPPSPRDALAAADELMYRVKRQGKGEFASAVLGDDAQPQPATETCVAAQS